MKCPTCVTEGERSRVTLGMGTSTLMSVDHFYDEDGEFHSHNPNLVTQQVHCSRGHFWTEQTRQPCPNPKCARGGSSEHS